MSNSAKFLGIKLDSKLNWRENLKDRIKKAYAALYSCQKLIGEKKGIKPALSYWLYTAVVRPIATYGCHVWWPILSHNVHAKAFNRINRIALMSLTGAMKTTPTAALEIILNVPPLDIHAIQTAKLIFVRLRETTILDNRLVRHSELLKDMERETVTDYLLPKNVLGKEIDISIPSLEDWEKNNITFSKVNIYTDGSKMSNGTGFGVYCEELNFEIHSRLNTDCSIFQAEVCAIAAAARQLSMLQIYRCDISFFIDSQAALMALKSGNIRSKVVSSCHKELMALREQHKINLCWVPGHKGILGNERADELAKKGANLPQDDALRDVFPPLSLTFQRIKENSKNKWLRKWHEADKYMQTKKLWDETRVDHSKTLLEMNRNQLRMTINLITGHNTLGKHMVRIGILEDDICRWCGDAEEDSYHFLCECPALSNRRLTMLGSYFFQNLEDIRGINPWSLLEFIKASKWNT